MNKSFKNIANVSSTNTNHAWNAPFYAIGKTFNDSYFNRE